MDYSIEYYSEGVDFVLGQQEHVSNWLELVSKRNGYGIRAITYIFCSDEYLLQLNQELLNHDTYTDVITVPYHEEVQDAVIGDIFVSVDRVKENAAERQSNFVDELHRVMAHGLLHLCGMTDEDEKAKLVMRNAEDLALNLRMF